MPLIDRRTRLKARRLMRRQKRQAESVVAVADESVEKLFVKRLHRLIAVRRFVAIWVLLLVFIGGSALWQVQALDKFYLENKPTIGGTYREGIIGVFSNANPLFTTTPVDAAVAQLLFSGLFVQAPNGQLEPDLAESIESDVLGRRYVVTLKQSVKWHDGESFTADDVVFTYQAIQNPNVKSSIRNNWVGVSVEKIDDYTVSFTLPSALSSFAYSLTNGIVPEHLLSSIEAEDLRSSSFNSTDPVGTGPFSMRRLEVVGNDVETRRERVALQRYENYHKPAAALDGIVIQTYRSEEAMVRDFENQSIQGMVGLNSVDEAVVKRDGVRIVQSPLTSAVMLFFNTSMPLLSDKVIRQALVQGTDVATIRSSLGYEVAPVDSPFLRDQFTYDPAVTQLPYDPTAAAAALEAAGWVVNADGIREKDGTLLQLRLVSQSLSEYAAVAQRVQSDWRAIGVKVDPVLQQEQDIQLNAIGRHDYDVLLYGIAIGFDPDVFAFWHSSQADPNSPNRLNLSEFKNAVADEALESGRTRLDQDLRKVKYDPFLEVWRDEAPAVGLYQPRFFMVVQGTFDGFVGGQFTRAVNRYYSVTKWKVKNDQAVKQPR